LFTFSPVGGAPGHPDVVDARRRGLAEQRSLGQDHAADQSEVLRHPVQIDLHDNHRSDQTGADKV
jgi:hypothetical protein